MKKYSARQIPQKESKPNICAGLLTHLNGGQSTNPGCMTCIRKEGQIGYLYASKTVVK
jgi:hypothetical protein